MLGGMFFSLEVSAIVALALLWSVIIYQSWKIGKELGDPRVWYLIIVAFIFVLVRVVGFLLTDQLGDDAWIVTLNWSSNFIVPACFLVAFHYLRKSIEKTMKH